MPRVRSGTKLIVNPKEELMSQTGIDIHSGRTGDVVVISGHRVGEHERLGEILEVLGEAGHAHYRVRWDDDSESVFYPGSDATIRRAHGSAPTSS